MLKVRVEIHTIQFLTDNHSFEQQFNIIHSLSIYTGKCDSGLLEFIKFNGPSQILSANGNV